MAIEITEVNGVKIDDVNLAEACEDEVLQQLTADSSSTDHEDARLMVGDISKS